MTNNHFLGCHPDDDSKAPQKPAGYEPSDIEDCWHCLTPVIRGACHCWDCADNGYIPISALWHCRTCGRWWAYMTGINITEITIG